MTVLYLSLWFSAKSLLWKIALVSSNWPPCLLLAHIQQKRLETCWTFPFCLFTSAWQRCTCLIVVWLSASKCSSLFVCSMLCTCYVLFLGCRETLYQTADLRRSTGLTHLNKLSLTSPVSSKSTFWFSFTSVRFCDDLHCFFFCLEQRHCPGWTQWQVDYRNAKPCLKCQPQ